MTASRPQISVAPGIWAQLHAASLLVCRLMSESTWPESQDGIGWSCLPFLCVGPETDHIFRVHEKSLFVMFTGLLMMECKRVHIWNLNLHPLLRWSLLTNTASASSPM